MKNNLLKAIAFALILFSFSACKQESNIYEWRNHRTGIYDDKDLLKQWPVEGPELVWEYEGIGNGFGSPVFTEDEMYITGEIEGNAVLFAFKINGELLWKKEYDAEWVKTYPGSRSAPTVVDDLIYVTTGYGNLHCLDRTTGEEKWKADLKKDYHGVDLMHGHSDNVLVFEDKVFMTPGGKDTNVVALNRFTGETIWISKGNQQRAGYNSPNLIKLKNRNLLVNFTAYELLGHDVETGKLLWIHEQDNLKPEERKPGMGDTHSNTVLFDEGSIYYAAGDGNGGVKLNLSADGTKITEEWRNPDFDSYMGGILKIGDYIYGCGTKQRDFKVVKATTGEITSRLKIGSGVVIAADDLLYYYNHKGEVMLIDPNPSELKLISSFRIEKGSKEHFAHPVIHNGNLYVRLGNVIQVFFIK